MYSYGETDGIKMPQSRTRPGESATPYSRRNAASGGFSVAIFIIFCGLEQTRVPGRPAREEIFFRPPAPRRFFSGAAPLVCTPLRPRRKEGRPLLLRGIPRGATGFSALRSCAPRGPSLAETVPPVCRTKKGQKNGGAEGGVTPRGARDKFRYVYIYRYLRISISRAISPPQNLEGGNSPLLFLT